jgi:lysophospholipase L1-like esterase
MIAAWFVGGVATAACGSTASVAPWQDGGDDGGVDSSSSSGDGASRDMEAAAGDGAASGGEGGVSQDGAARADGGPSDAAARPDAGGPSDAATRPDTDGGNAEEGGMTAGPRWLGRVDASDPSAVRFAWSASGLAATVTGSTISVSLATEVPGGGTGPVFFQPVIDGVVGARFSVSSAAQTTVVLGSGLPAGPHAVELYRDTEAEIEGVLYVSIFYGFVDGQVVGAPPPKGRLIEIVGDSISCGYGNLCSGPDPFSVDTEAAYQAYGPQLARILTADVSIVAHSGWGVYQDLSGNTANVMPAVYGNTLGTAPSPLWDFSAQPDAVVINLGTNDSAQGDPGTPYETAYLAFLQTVRAHNPNAWIFLTIGPMTSDPELTKLRNHIANVIRAFGDSRVAQINLATQNTASVGCDYHPTVDEDKTMAMALSPTIRAKLGW